MTPAAHFLQLEFVHDFPLRSFVNVFLGQINYLFGVHVASHFQSPNFAEVVFVFVSNDVATGEALYGDDHCGGYEFDSNITLLFLNQFLKIKKYEIELIIFDTPERIHFLLFFIGLPFFLCNVLPFFFFNVFFPPCLENGNGGI